MHKNKENAISIKERIGRIAERWYVLEPLYFLLWTTHELSVNPGIKTLRTGGGKIEYNPEFIDSMPDKLLAQVLEWELVRIALKHPYMRRQEIASVSYMASNLAIKEHTKIPLPFPTAHQFFGSNQHDKKHFEFYYHQLLDKKNHENDSSNVKNSKKDNKNEQESEGKKGGNGEDTEKETAQTPENTESDPKTPQDSGRGDEGLTESSDETAPSFESYADGQKTGAENAEQWQTDELRQEQINDKIETAILNNSWGTIKGQLKETILASLKPKVDYRNILNAFRASILSQRRALTRMKPSRRYGFQYMGSRREFSTKLLVAVDVSGSMDNKAIAKGYSIINHFFKYGIEQVDVIQFDAVVQGEAQSLKKARKQITVTGRGGTNFQPVLDYIGKNPGYDALIVFTDGYASTPKKPESCRTRILWLFDTEKNYKSSKDYLSMLGKCAFIKE